MSATILCVDDDRHLCRILGKALSGEGYRVLTAHDGSEALQLLRDEAPNLVILDVLLPRHDGFEVLHEVRQLTGEVAQTPVVMMTGCRITPQYEERAAQLGAAQMLAKPVPLTQLFETVHRHLKEPSPTRGRGQGSRGQGGRRAASASGAPARARRGSGASKPLEGSFSELAFPHLLHHLHGLRATGVLMLSNGKKRKAVQLRDGYPVAVKSNLVDECLGNLLLKRGALSQEVLRESLRRVKKGEGLQGEILVAMEVLSEDEVSAALRQQAVEKLFEVFGWKRGQFRFEIGGRLKQGNELALETSPANLILTGVRRRMHLDRIDAFLNERADSFVAAGESPFYRFQEIELAAEERALLGGLDGSQRLRDFLSEDESVRRTLFGLIATEMLDLRSSREAPAGTDRSETVLLEDEALGTHQDDGAVRSELAAMAEKLRSQSYFEMLGLDEAAAAEQVAQAYSEMAQRTHPDRYSTASSAVRQLADEVHQLITRAHDTLSDPKKRSHYAVEVRRGQRKAAEAAESKRALDAEIEFQKGEARLRSRDYELALRYFGEALQRNPGDGEYHAYYGWCLHLCHPDDVTIAQEAIEHVRNGAKLARDREKPYLFLGRLYKAVGKTPAAEKMFTRAVQIRPDCVEALRELRLINLRREKSKGLVRRLLRR